MIKLMHINNHIIDTSKFDPLLHDKVVEEFEQSIADFVGAKYACSFHSATMAIFLTLLEGDKKTVSIPSIIPPVVANAVLCSGNKINYYDDVDWVGSSYILHDFGDYKIIDSAQQLSKNQFIDQANDQDLMVFSFYPTKPVGSCDGGMIVSNDKSKIDRLRILSRNGMSLEKDSWDRSILLPGWKMYMNSIQASIAMENFQRLPEKTRRYEEIKAQYNEAFGLNNVSNHLYRITVDNNDKFLKIMSDKGIQCGVHYRAVHQMNCYKLPDVYLPKSERESSTTASIPFHEKLTDDQVEYIIKEVKDHVITP